MEPKIVNFTIVGPVEAEWTQAMEGEIESLKENIIWTHDDFLKECSARLVPTMKSKGIIERYKTRLGLTTIRLI